MSSDVALKQPRSGETLPAILTLASLVVSPHVHGKCRHADVEFVAVWTSPCLFVRGTSMGLSVPREVTGSAVPFSTVRAFVLVMFSRGDGFAFNMRSLLNDGLRISVARWVAFAVLVLKTSEDVINGRFRAAFVDLTLMTWVLGVRAVLSKSLWV